MLLFKFRKKALEKLKSPEELDQMLKITSPLSWLLLIASIIAVMATLFWSIYGTIPSRVSGKGLFLTRNNALIDAVAYEYGKVIAIYVQEGQTVTQNQALLKISREDLNSKIDELEKKLSTLINQKNTYEKRVQDETDTRTNYVNNQIIAIKQNIDSRQKDLDYINSTLQKKQLMAQQGYLTKDQLESTLQQQREYTRDITAAQSEILRLQNSIQELQNNREEKLNEIERDIEDANVELELTKTERDNTENIKSPSSGEIISMPVNIGDHVERGQPIISILQPGNNLIVAGFVPAEEEGRKITPGMKVLIEPAGIKREMYGTMVGKVSFVSPFPVSVERLIAILHNEDLAKKIALTTSLLEIRISLLQIQDPKTEKWQYQWTSKFGQQFTVKPGTLCKINVTVDTNPPITLVIPALKKLIGVY